MTQTQERKLRGNLTGEDCAAIVLIVIPLIIGYLVILDFLFDHLRWV